jgi:hypothetical protein
MARANALRVGAAMLIAAAMSAACAAAAPAAGGPAIPGAYYGGEGAVGPPGEPSGALRYVTMYGGKRTVLARIAVDDGTVTSSRPLRGQWALPAVTLDNEAGGLAADGETLVLIRPTYSPRQRTTTFLLLDGNRRLRIADRLVLDGAFSFDAISPDGRLMYLVEYEDPRNPLDYRVRAYDLAAGSFRPGRIVDPSEPDEAMTGQPVARATSPDGRWAYTLYGGGEETFIHALDTQEATAVCVDVPQLDGNIFRWGLEVDPASGAIAVLKRGETIASVDPETFEVAPAQSGTVPEDDGGGVPWAVIAIVAGVAVVAGGATTLRRRGRRPAAELPPDPLPEDEITAPVARGAGERK